METSINGKGDLEKGLLDSTEKTSDIQCSEVEKGAIITVVITVVLLASLGFLIYLGVVVLKMKSDVNQANALAIPIDKLTQKVGNLYTYVEDLDTEIRQICQANQLNCS